MVDSPIPGRRSQVTPRQFNGLVRGVENVYKDAPAETRLGGRLWYPEAHDIAADIGRQARVRVGGTEDTLDDVRRGAGIIAALSPQIGWRQNVVLARQFAAKGVKAGGHTRAFLDKADAIREGEDPEPILGSPLHHQGGTSVAHKTHSFYRNIVDPDDPHPVTIDRHAHDLAVGSVPLSDADRGLSSAGRYDTFADAYRTAARRLGVATPSEVQATTWTHWRNVHGQAAEYD